MNKQEQALTSKNRRVRQAFVSRGNLTLISAI